MTATAAPALPWRPLAGLTLAVLAVHLVLLEAAPASLRFDEAQPIHRFVTRTIVLNPPQRAQPTLPSPAVAPVLAPAPVRPRAAAVPASVPAAAPAPTAEPGATSATAAATSPEPEAAAAASAPTPAASAPVAAVPPVLPTPVPTPVAAAFAVPGSVRLQYMVSGQQGSQPLGGVTADLVWLQDGEKYDAQLSFHLLFRTLRSQRSTGRITGTGLTPERFLDKRRTEVAANFERDKGRISFSANTPDAPLLTGAQDRLSLFLQLASLLAGNPAAYPAGAAINVQTVGPRDADVWVFTVAAAETLQLPAGELQAVRLTRNPRREFDQKVEAWFAPSLGYLPVKLKITDANGDTVEQQLRASGAP